MANTFSLLRRRCGLSVAETAGYLGVPEPLAQSWEEAPRGVPPRAIHRLRALYRTLEKSAEAQVAQVRAVAPFTAVLELGLASDDVEAQQFGLPCVGAHEALLGLIAARLNRHVRVVPAGSTVATAAALARVEEQDRK
jgi:hypothetical protein